MEPEKFIDFIELIGRLRLTGRHCWHEGRRESVAEHSWRLAVMARLLKDQLPPMDNDKLVTMCLIHDWGEAITGDVPSFYKTDRDRAEEDVAIDKLAMAAGEEYQALFKELAQQQSLEARACKALDKLEAVISHNEAELETWIPLEYTENARYGTQECAQFPYLAALRELARQESIDKVAGGTNV